MDSKMIQADGSLRSITPYVNWIKGGEKITLDAEFTIDDLLWLVSYMKTGRAGETDYG